jgi:polar amino acid transport system substrate-binding protein
MKQHPTLGHHILSAAELDDIATWIRHHHERIDGCGYPEGLAGDAIPFESRILMVADAFEAITADRPYRDRRSVGEAMVELERHSGTQFDPRCLAALARVVGPRPYASESVPGPDPAPAGAPLTRAA